MSYSKLVKLPLSDIIHKNAHHSLRVDSSADDRNINSRMDCFLFKNEIRWRDIYRQA